MPPKAKAKAGAKAKASNADASDDKILVPPPPPTPVLVKFPENFSEESAAARCVLLAWLDRTGAYKLQSRAYTVEERDITEGWTDVQEVREKPIGSRNGVYLASGLQYVRAEYRLATKSGDSHLEGKFVANWFSAPSDPVVSVIDPPAKPSATVVTRGDYDKLGVDLRFTSTNEDDVQLAPNDAEIAELGPWAAWPGLGICKVQARWRALRLSPHAQIEESGGDTAAAERFFGGANDGERRVGPIVEVGVDRCRFDASSSSWSFCFSDIPHGLVVRFEVRVGTAYRWSRWSEESDDIAVEIPPPLPVKVEGADVITVVSTTDSTAKVRWSSFALAPRLSLCEYRVMVCQLGTPTGEILTNTESQWDSFSQKVVGIFTARQSTEAIEFEARGLVADSFYLVRVDARYPFVSERGWSMPAITVNPAHTSFASRPPPLAPMALPTNYIEDLAVAGDGLETPFTDEMPWCVLLIEQSSFQDYRIEYSISRPPPVDSTVTVLEGGIGEWYSAAKALPLGIPHGDIAVPDSSDPKTWMALAVLFDEDPEAWDQDVIVCRLRHMTPAIVSPHLGTGSTSMPLVPKIEPPAHCSGDLRYSEDLSCFGILVRFYLGSAGPEKQHGPDPLAVLAEVKNVARNAGKRADDDQGTRTSVHIVGHRHVTQYQLCAKATSGESKDVIFPPKSLPEMRERHRDLQPGPLPVVEGDLPTPASALVWDVGDRYETLLTLNDGLQLGLEYTVYVRVGTSTRWSPWCATAEAIPFELPTPKPLPGKNGKELRLTCTMESATSVQLQFPPFILAPGVVEAEYHVTAQPMLVNQVGDENDDNESASMGRQVSEPTGERAAIIRKSEVKRQRTVRTDEQALKNLIKKGSLSDLPDVQRLTALFNHEAEEDMNAVYSNLETEKHQVQISGLLPATRYKFTVEARFVGSVQAQESIPMRLTAETPCGDAPPSKPTPLPYAKIASIDTDSTCRLVFLEIEDRADYVLECMGAPLETENGWYPSDGERSSRRSAEGGTLRWWTFGKDELDATGDWITVATRRIEFGSVKLGFQNVIAELPEFRNSSGSVRVNSELPDMLWFRLRVSDRDSSHPCRWIGNASEALASCIAPVAAPPFVSREFDDHSWQAVVTFFCHKSTRPAVNAVGDIYRSVVGDAVYNRFMDGEEEPPPFGDQDATEDLEGHEIPVGYGHRKISSVQARARLVGASTPNGDIASYRSMSREWIELPTVLLSHCKANAPASFKGAIAERVGDLFKMTISGTNILREGGVYQVQMRVGDGFRWSSWSASSRRFTYGVPQPEVGEGVLEIETLSANSVRLRWPGFKVPNSLCDVEYLLRAEPIWSASTPQGVRTVCATHVIPIETLGEAQDAELCNVLAATPYTFSVSARYPRIGWRAWSSCLCAEPQTLNDTIADWAAPAAPIAVPHNGPRPFVLSEGLPCFHPNERAFLLGFPDTSNTPDGIAYQLEYKHVCLLGDDVSESSSDLPVDFRTNWRTPVEITRVHDLSEDSARLLCALVAPWKATPLLWRVRLPMMPKKDDADAFTAQLQRIQFRLAAKIRADCPVTRWYSAPTLPICAGMAPPRQAHATLQISDSHLGVKVTFALDNCLAPGLFASEVAAAAQRALLELEASTDDSNDSPMKGSYGISEAGLPEKLPDGFGHAFATRFQLRSRHSPRPPGEVPTERGRKPPGVPWSAWIESTDADLKANTSIQQEGSSITYSIHLTLPNSAPFEYGSWYQTAIRISDGVCWSDWCEPSVPVKVFVAPPKVERPDTDALVVDRSSGGNNIKLRWNPLRAHGGLRLVDYALFVREVLHDRSELCPRHIATLIEGHSSKSLTNEDETSPSPQANEQMMYEVRDLRQDVTYIFTLAARYPNIGPRDFDDALSSSPTSLRPVCAPLPVPMQLPLPPERLRRMQGMRCVLLKWSFQGLPPSQALAAKDSDADMHHEKFERQYDLQALPEGAKDNEWVLCKNVTKTQLDGAVAWFVKDVPGQVLRSRFRLWEKDTGRFGRTSPLMLSLMEPVKKVGVICVVAESAAQIVLRAPLDANHGSHEFVCRYQVRFKAEQMGSEWTELPIQMLWHRQNDHLASLDVPVDSTGAVVSGLPTKETPSDMSGRAVSFNARAASSPVPEGHNEANGEQTGEQATEEGKEGKIVRTPQLPTIPLAAVGPAGDVYRQHCLVSVIREEDGLQLNTSLTFSVRVGDLYRLSDWSEPSSVVKLVVPPPSLDLALSADEARVRVGDVTDTSLSASWPQFFPAAGVPIHSEVEYLLTVAPQAPKRKLAGRGVQREEKPPQQHSQWLLSSTAQKGLSMEEAGRQAQTLGVSVTGLAPHSAYELKLSVRYARLGLRKWTEALAVVALTKKPDAETQRLNIEKHARLITGGNHEELSTLKRMVPVPLDAGKLESRSQHKDSSRKVSAAESPLTMDSPRKLPPIDVPVGQIDAIDPATPHADVNEWMEVAQTDASRITGGNAVTSVSIPDGKAPNLSYEDELEYGYPRNAKDHVPFWRRDPMDSRPTMPQMPSSGHSAMQLDLVGRAKQFPEAQHASDTRAVNPQIVVPRPPTSERVSGRIVRPTDIERVAYPRRFIHE